VRNVEVCHSYINSGGGKAIDTCKVLAHETNRPFFTFPTIASTCASCTSLGIVYHPDGSLREYSFSKIPPNHIFINTEIIANAPARSLGAVNVQVIMESLGGGGHQTMAAAQLKHITPEAAHSRIQTAIDQYREAQKKSGLESESEQKKKDKQ